MGSTRHRSNRWDIAFDSCRRVYHSATFQTPSSSTVTGTRSAIGCATGLSVRHELPLSPRSRGPTQRHYLSVPEQVETKEPAQLGDQCGADMFCRGADDHLYHIAWDHKQERKYDNRGQE